MFPVFSFKIEIEGKVLKGLLVITHWEKKQDVAGEAGPAEVGHHFSGTKALFLVSGDNHSSILCKCRLALSLSPRTLDSPATLMLEPGLLISSYFFFLIIFLFLSSVNLSLFLFTLPLQPKSAATSLYQEVRELIIPISMSRLQFFNNTL